MTRTASRFLAAAAACVITADTIGLRAGAQSLDLQTTCAARADAAFQELGRESKAVLESLNAPFDITALNYQAHYSSKVARCLLLVRKTLSVMRASSGTSYLIDAGDRRMYALYVDMDGKMESCTLIPSIQDMRTCKDRNEFDAFVAVYMGKNQGEQ